MEKLSPDWLAWPETQALIRAFGATPLRFVGGSVRDSILGRKVQDVDAATPLAPEGVMKLLGQAKVKVIPTGIDHGTVTAVVGAHHFEITTLRRDVTTDGRRATVAYTEDWKEDASRRDFTMNALYCAPDGTLFDYFGGSADARAGRVKFIGDAATRISEDALRILRFFRFFAHYGKGSIDAEGLAACAAGAAKIDALSGERIEQEMMKLLVAGTAGEVVSLMQQQKIWPHIVPHIVSAASLSQLPVVLRKAHHRPDALLSLAALLRSINPDTAAAMQAIDERWKLSKADYKKLQTLCERSIAPEIWADEKKMKKHIRALGKDLCSEQLLLLMAEGASIDAGMKVLALVADWQIPEFPVTGGDLLARGMKPGKALGDTLLKLEKQWEEGGYTASKEALLSRFT